MSVKLVPYLYQLYSFTDELKETLPVFAALGQDAALGQHTQEMITSYGNGLENSLYRISDYHAAASDNVIKGKTREDEVPPPLLVATYGLIKKLQQIHDFLSTRDEPQKAKLKPLDDTLEGIFHKHQIPVGTTCEQLSSGHKLAARNSSYLVGKAVTAVGVLAFAGGVAHHQVAPQIDEQTANTLALLGFGAALAGSGIIKTVAKKHGKQISETFDNRAERLGQYRVYVRSKEEGASLPPPDSDKGRSR